MLDPTFALFWSKLFSWKAANKIGLVMWESVMQCLVGGQYHV